MSRVALVRHSLAPHTAQGYARPDSPPREAEHVEEVWDAELVGELPPPGWLALPVLTSYARAGFSVPPSRIDVRA